MNTKKVGALPYQTLLAMTKNKFIKGAKLENIKPSSLDLSVSDEIIKWKVFFSHGREKVCEMF